MQSNGGALCCYIAAAPESLLLGEGAGQRLGGSETAGGNVWGGSWTLLRRPAAVGKTRSFDLDGPQIQGGGGRPQNLRDSIHIPTGTVNIYIFIYYILFMSNNFIIC